MSNNVVRRRNSYDFCLRLQEFYGNCYSKSSSTKNWVIDPKGIKSLVRRKFDPIAQHDSHEFMVWLFEQIQDELTPKNTKWDGSDPKIPLS